MSDHHGHHHDHGGNEPPWVNRLKLVLALTLAAIMMGIIVLEKLHILSN